MQGRDVKDYKGKEMPRRKFLKILGCLGAAVGSGVATFAVGDKIAEIVESENIGTKVKDWMVKNTNETYDREIQEKLLPILKGKFRIGESGDLPHPYGYLDEVIRLQKEFPELRDVGRTYIEHYLGKINNQKYLQEGESMKTLERITE